MLKVFLENGAAESGRLENGEKKNLKQNKSSRARRRVLHRARPPEDRDRPGRGLRPQAERKDALRLRQLKRRNRGFNPHIKKNETQSGCCRAKLFLCGFGPNQVFFNTTQNLSDQKPPDASPKAGA